MKKGIALLLALSMALATLTGCSGGTNSADASAEAVTSAESGVAELTDEEIAANVADLIDAIYVQTRTDETDEQCAAAKAAWDALTDEQKELVEGENADPDYFGLDTVDASAEDTRNQDDIGQR
ncbi:MAG: cobalt chelatase, partial [Clostridiales bacterium]|nr:cobalt chelatase [Clostridiales bacterium]